MSDHTLMLIVFISIFFVVPILVVLLQPFFDTLADWAGDLLERYYNFLGYEVVEEDELEKI